MQTLTRLLKLIAPFKWWIALAALLGFATIGSSVGLMATSAYIIAKAALHPSIVELQVAIVGVRFFGVSRGLFRYLERYVAHLVTFRLLARLRTWFYATIEPLAPAGLIHHRSGDLLNRMVSDVETLENFYIRALAPPITALLSVGLVGLLIGWFDPRLSVALMTMLGLVGVGLPLLNQALSRQPSRRLIDSRADLNTTLLDGVQGTADLLVFGRAGDQQRRVVELSQTINRQQERLAWARGLSNGLTVLLSSLASVLLLWMAIPLVTSGQLEGVYLALLALVALASFEAVIPLTEAAEHWERSLAAAGRLFEVTSQTPQVAERRGDHEGSPAQGTGAGCSFGGEVSITIDNLTFRYPDTESPALAEVSLSVGAGQRVAVVGASGAGKSSLLNLMVRFWEYQGGEIRLNGHDLRTLPPSTVRAMMAVVSQRTHLFNGTVRDNLRLACLDASEGALFDALRQAQLDQFVSQLPHGLDSWIGEQGVRLSGGERQRLAMARAILQDAPLLLLDEPTANLDATTERQVLKSLHRLMDGRTSLLITHRLVDLAAMDSIIVLHEGRIVEQGRHDDLLAQGGVYQRMWTLQQNQLDGVPTQPAKSG